jgi:hypothetical protein
VVKIKHVGNKENVMNTPVGASGLRASVRRGDLDVGFEVGREDYEAAGNAIGGAFDRLAGLFHRQRAQETEAEIGSI